MDLDWRVISALVSIVITFLSIINYLMHGLFIRPLKEKQLLIEKELLELKRQIEKNDRREEDMLQRLFDKLDVKLDAMNNSLLDYATKSMTRQECLQKRGSLGCAK